MWKWRMKGKFSKSYQFSWIQTSMAEIMQSENEKKEITVKALVMTKKDKKLQPSITIFSVSWAAVAMKLGEHVDLV